MFKAPSRIVFEREKAKERELHQQHLQQVRGFVDHHPSNAQALSTTNLFRQRHTLLMESKQAELDRQNQFFAKKLFEVGPTLRTTTINIGPTSTTNSSSSGNHSHSNSHNTTHNNNNHHNNHLHQNNHHVSDSYGIRGSHANHGGDSSHATDRNSTTTMSAMTALHQNARIVSQHRRIEEENEQYFKRIASTKSVFDVAKWAAEAKDHEKVLQVHTLFPAAAATSNNHVHNTSRSNNLSQILSAQNTSFNNNGNKAVSANSKQNNNNTSILSIHAQQSNAATASGALDITTYHKKILAYTKANSFGMNIQQQQQGDEISNSKEGNRNVATDTSMSVSKLPPMSSLSLPPAFFSTLSNDAQRSSFLKKIIRENKTYLYRKPVEVEEEMFFAEIKIEQGQFKIELENAHNEIYQLSIPEEQGIAYFRCECNEEMETLFKKMKLNRFDKSITLIQKHLLQLRQTQELLKNRQQVSQKQSRTTRNSQHVIDDSRSDAFSRAGGGEDLTNGTIEAAAIKNSKNKHSKDTGISGSSDGNLPSMGRKSQSQPEIKAKKKVGEFALPPTKGTVKVAGVSLHEKNNQKADVDSKKKPAGGESKQKQQQSTKDAQKNEQKQKVKKPIKQQAEESKKADANGWDDYEEDEFEKFDIESDGEVEDEENTNGTKGGADKKMSTFTFKNNTSYKATNTSDNLEKSAAPSKKEQHPQNAKNSTAVTAASKLEKTTTNNNKSVQQKQQQSQGQSQAKNTVAAAKSSKETKQEKQPNKQLAAGASGKGAVVQPSQKKSQAVEEEENYDIDIDDDYEVADDAADADEKYEIEDAPDNYGGDEFYEEDSGTQYEINDEDKEIISQREKKDQEESNAFTQKKQEVKETGKGSGAQSQNKQQSKVLSEEKKKEEEADEDIEEYDADFD